jgi:oligopeptide transport system substrate-binding protein
MYRAVWAWSFLIAAVSIWGLSACAPGPWNNPYPADEARENVFYGEFSERPKHLDPARSYSANEVVFTGQVYEPPLQYHYLKRPYTLIPLTAAAVPHPAYLDEDGRPLPDDAPPERIARSVYEIRIQPGIYYQPHPAFARDAEGNPLYRDLTPEDLEEINVLADFPETGTRELVAADYVYQVKRLAHPRLHSPLFGLMSEYIVGLRAYAAELKKADEELKERGADDSWLDLRRYPLEGVELVDRYTYRITLNGKYPQFVYWLAMPFFAPVPPEAEHFYSQPGMSAKNITLDWYPVGTGPYMLVENNPNQRMVLARNPNFHGEAYPGEGDPGDAEQGLLADAGKPMPFIDKAVYSLEKEDIPIWNKFLQGYYDISGVSSDAFDQAIQIGSGGEATLTEDMKAKGIRLQTAVATSNWYMAFNMMDPVVGGNDARAAKIRRAISIAVDYEEFIAIFSNGRGIPAHGPLPPGIFGYRDGPQGINPYVYDWVDGRAKRKSIEEARRLMAEAGYPEGRDAATGKPLVLYFDTMAIGPDAKARLDWFRKQFLKLNVQLVIRSTDYNRFQEKMLKGTAQIFEWGWNADYPDPENFLFLLYGPNGKVDTNGENAANYRNEEFDRLFLKMKDMDNGPGRQAVIDEMVAIARRDAPWLWGFYPKSFGLLHQWYLNSKPNLMANNTLKYKRIDPELRARLRAEWNRPVLWPVWLVVGVLVVGALPAVISYRRRERATPKQEARA